jgi:hypothetical protein
VRKRSETGPARCRWAPARAANVARSRTRQIRPRDASAREPGGRAARRVPPWCACGGETHGSWRACGCSVGTCASTKSLLEAPRAARGRGPRGRRKPPSVRPGSPGSQRGEASGENGRDPLLHKDPRCYVARFARRRPAGRDFPGVSPLDQADTSTTVGTISTPVDALVDNLRRTADAPGSADQQSGRRWWTVVEKNGER